MDIKSLLFGSAAALLAMSGAQAADAVEVAAEPEPMEYVRVCDTYGTGYFYIPGTETCLRIGGYVRYDIGIGDGAYGGHVAPDRDGVAGDFNDTYHKEARFSLQTWTGTETELGTLSTYTETQFNYTDGYSEDHAAGSDATLNFAWIQLGGFRVGKDESAFSQFPDYAGGVIADDIIAYGPIDTNLISYTFDAGNGFSAMLALETGEAGTEFEIDSYVPHVVAGAKYSGDWGGVTAVGGYDSVYEEWAAKLRLDVNVNEQLSLFAMAGYGSDGELNNYRTWSGDWAVWAGGSYKFSEKATFNLQGSYTDSSDFADDGWAVVADVDYQIVPDFHIIPEISYSDLGVDDAPGTDGFGGMLRFQRDF